MCKETHAEEEGQEVKPEGQVMRRQTPPSAAADKPTTVWSRRRYGTAWTTVPLAVFAMLVSASSALASFGIENASVIATTQSGSEHLQAGPPPYALTTSFHLNPRNVFSPFSAGEGSLRNVRVELPPGFVGNPTVVPQCRLEDFESGRGCPDDTVVGYAATYFERERARPAFNPLYNMEPSPGIPAEFAYKAIGVVPIFLNASVRTGGDYGLNVDVHNVPNLIALAGAGVTVWGVPADPSHNPLRGRCLSSPNEIQPPEPISIGNCSVNVPVRPYLTNPASCIPRTAIVRVGSWEQPGFA